MPVRFKAFLVHLACSSVIALLALLLVFRFWYPAPLHEALGVTEILLLVLLVDVILGPLLTMVVYKAGKKTLALDLAVIACLQLAALGYGLWTVAEGRPAWIVFSADRFDLVQVVDLDTRKLGDTPAEYRQPAWTGPRWVAAVPPADPEANRTLILEALYSGLDLPQRPNLYQPLASQHETLRQKMLGLAELTKFNSEEQVGKALKQWPKADAWLPLMARAKPMVVLLQKETAEVVAIVDLNPWNP